MSENKETAKEPFKWTLQPLANVDTHKHLDQDENIAYVGEINKERI